MTFNAPPPCEHEYVIDPVASVGVASSVSQTPKSMPLELMTQCRSPPGGFVNVPCAGRASANERGADHGGERADQGWPAVHVTSPIVHIHADSGIVLHLHDGVPVGDAAAQPQLSTCDHDAAGELG